METRHEACSGRASLATASIHIRTDSRAFASRCHVAVIALSTAVMYFQAISPAQHAPRGRVTVNGAATRQMPAASIRYSSPASRAPAIFIISKPHPRLSRRGESPLSDAAALYPARTRGSGWLDCSITREAGRWAFWLADAERSDTVGRLRRQLHGAGSGVDLRHAQLSEFRRGPVLDRQLLYRSGRRRGVDAAQRHRTR